MDRNQLKESLEKLFQDNLDQDKKCLEKKLEDFLCLLPAQEYDYSISFLREKDIISLKEIDKFKKCYMNSNKNLILYGIDSRLFAEIWAIEHLKRIDPKFRMVNRDMDLEYVGQYDALFEKIKLGIKACRAINCDAKGDRFQVALRSDSSNPFVVRFKQLKIDTCAVFVFIGVWVDKMLYWVLSDKEIKANKHLVIDTNPSIGNIITINKKNIADFDLYKVTESEIVSAIVKRSQKNE